VDILNNASEHSKQKAPEVNLLLFQYLAADEEDDEDETAVVSSVSSVSSTETRQVLMTSPRRPSSTVRV
jgi:hypothetical protein